MHTHIIMTEIYLVDDFSFLANLSFVSLSVIIYSISTQSNRTIFVYLWYWLDANLWDKAREDSRNDYQISISPQYSKSLYRDHQKANVHHFEFSSIAPLIVRAIALDRSRCSSSGTHLRERIPTIHAIVQTTCYLLKFVPTLRYLLRRVLHRTFNRARTVAIINSHTPGEPSDESIYRSIFERQRFPFAGYAARVNAWAWRIEFSPLIASKWYCAVRAL